MSIGQQCSLLHECRPTLPPTFKHLHCATLGIAALGVAQVFKGPRIWYKTVREIVTIVRMHNAFASGLMQYGLIRGTKQPVASSPSNESEAGTAQPTLAAAGSR
jgi:hypothetical protein